MPPVAGSSTLQGLRATPHPSSHLVRRPPRYPAFVPVSLERRLALGERRGHTACS